MHKGMRGEDQAAGCHGNSRAAIPFPGASPPNRAFLPPAAFQTHPRVRYQRHFRQIRTVSHSRTTDRGPIRNSRGTETGQMRLIDILSSSSSEITAMFRSGFLLSVSGPAVLLTLLIQPTVQQAADQWSASAPASIHVQASLPGQRVASTAISPIRVASVNRPESRALPATTGPSSRTASEKDQPKVRRMREGCEGAISSLAGPEARRMLPGRCIS